MRKKVFGRKFSRDYGARRALFASLIRALILHGKVVTTKEKAKAIQGQVEKMVTLAKIGKVAERRRVYAMLRNDREETDILLSVASALSARSSGFTRIVNLPSRVGDRARMARLEWTQEIESYTRTPRKEKKIGKDKERKSQEAQKAAEGKESSAPSVIKKISKTLRRDKKTK